MNELERRLERLTRIPSERWILMLATVVTAGLASVVGGASGGGQSLLVTVLVVAAAIGSAVRPATHTALAVVVLVTWQWLVTTDDALSPLAVVVAICLLAFHTIVALLAATPLEAEIDPAIGRRWARRTTVVGAATIGVWAASLVMEQRQAPGSVALTLLGFVTIIALVLGLRATRRPTTS